MYLPPPPPDAMTDAEQTAFARFLRSRLPEFQERDPPLYTLTWYSARVLQRPRLLHWRGITRSEAQLVMQAAIKEYPQRSRPE